MTYLATAQKGAEIRDMTGSGAGKEQVKIEGDKLHSSAQVCSGGLDF
jgi:hypothetical protein